MKKVVLTLVILLLLAVVGAASWFVTRSDRDASTADPTESTGSTGSSSPATDTPTTDSGDATEPPDPALAEFYSQELDWSACGDNECSTMTVPVDYDDPTGETIEINLVKVPAQDPEARVGSMVVNPGGPGAPGTQYAEQAEYAFGQPLRDSFDIVGFDPRGTGASSPVDCLSDDQIDEYIASDPDPDTTAEETEFADWVDTIGQGCVDNTGELINHVTTIETAEDMDVLRAALGDEKLTYFGASYGTKLGATYAELFPERVGRFVLDGAVDVSISSRQSSLEQAAGFEQALRAYVQDCVDNEPDCYLGDSVDGGLARIQGFLADVDAKPLSTGTDRDLAVGNAFYGIVAPLYNRDYWFMLTSALQDGFDGDGAALLQLSDLYTSRGPGGYTDNSVEAIYAINCLDDSWSVPPTAEAVDKELPDFQKASPTFGTVFAWGTTGCSGLQAKSTVDPITIDGAGADPIVVIGTTRDPATPMKWAEALSAQLDSGVLIKRDGDGHTGYNAGNQCVDTAVEDYMIKGDVPEDGLSC